MFDNVSFRKDEKGIVTIKGLFGNRFSRLLEKNILKRDRLKQLFINYGALEISFHEFFALEVRVILSTYKDLPYRKNEVIIDNAIKSITENTWLANEDREYKDTFDYGILKSKMKYEILPHQQEWFSEYNASKKRHHRRGRLLAAGAGLGKALKWDTKVKIPNGWKEIGLLKIDDLVMSKDGTYTRVNGVYPQGKRDIYRITFKDGRYADCDLNHLWEIYDRNKGKHIKSKDKKSEVINTEEIINRFKHYKKRKGLYIDLPEPDTFDNKEKLLIDPYLLGVLIGDGCLRTNIKFSNNDEFVINKVTEIVDKIGLKVNKLQGYDYSIVDPKQGFNKLKVSLEYYGLYGTYSHQKFIPKEYLNSSLENRIRLLNGLMDTDGTVDSDTPSFSTSSKQLAEDIQLLVRSLGGIARMGIKETFYTKGPGTERVKCRLSYRITIRHKRPKELFSLPRQMDKLKEVNQYSKNLKLRIELIEKLDRQHEAVCIAVDHPDKLFVIKDYIVTHNTYMSLALSELVLSDKVVIICPSQAIETVWHKSLDEDLYLQPQPYHSSIHKKEYNGERFIVCHYEAMNDLFKLIKYIKGKGTTVIIDESHNLNEESSKRTNLMISICKAIGTDNIMLLSGSPIKAMPMEMLPMIEVLDLGFDPIIKNRFIKLYKSMPKVLKPAIKERYSGYRTYIPKDALNLPPIITENINIRLNNAKEYTLENIKNKMRAYAETRISELTKDYNMYQVRYDSLYEKAKDKLTYNTMKFKDFEVYELSIKKIKLAYNENRLMFITDTLAYANKFEKEIILPALDNPEEKKQFKEAKTIVKYLKLKVQGEILGLVVGKERINCHMDMAKAIDYKSLINSTTQKTLIFSNYIDVCEVCYSKVEKIGYKPLKVYGNDTKYLNQNVLKFTDEKSEDNPMVTTYKSLSTAVPLITANVAIMLDLPFRSYIYDQAVARLQRLGQKATNIFVYQISLDTGDIPNINSRNIDIIEWSKNMVEEITGHSANVEIIKSEGTDEGKRTVVMDEVISSFYKLTPSKEEKKEISILDVTSDW